MSHTANRLVLHVGPHKTASSYIQENLSQERRALEGRSWVYPREGTQGLSGHHDLAHKPDDYLAAGAPHRQALASAGRHARENGRSIIFSAEGFCLWPPSRFDRLAALLGFDSYEIIYVIRDPLEIFQSFWAEEVKQGITLGFAERFAHEFADPDGSRILNPMHDLRPLLGRSDAKVHAVPYDALCSGEIDIFEHIAHSILGLPDVSARHKAPVNVRYPVELTEFIRLLTLIHGNGQANIGPDLRLMLVARTTPQELREFATLVRTHGAHARRVLTVPAGVTFRKRVEKILRTSLSENWSLRISDEQPLFPERGQNYIYYDTHLLYTTDVLRQAAETVLERLLDEAGSP